jgi:hypothetical protein
MSNIKTIETKKYELDVDRVFAHYKYAVPEHDPIKLSNGNYLHVYRVTRYDDFDPQGDSDVEQDFCDREMYG